MKFFSLPSLFVAFLFSAILVVPFLPSASKRPHQFILETRLASSAAGVVQLYYDDGTGFREDASIRASLTKSAEPQSYRLFLPSGKLRGIRLDPIDGIGVVTIQSAQVMDDDGHVLRVIPLQDFKAQHQIQSLRETASGLEVTTTSSPDTDDPQLLVTLSPTLHLQVSWQKPVATFLRWTVIVFAVLSAGIFGLARAPRLQQVLAGSVRWAMLEPNRAIALGALLAVVASAYPVVFLGKSYVSPNIGTTLLYDTFPTLPGYKGDRTADVKGSDIGAIMWQHLPYSMLQHEALLKHGELPLWNRYNSCGTTLQGQGQSMFGDPLHTLVILAKGAAWAWDLKYLIAKWLLAAGLGFCVFALTRYLPSALVVCMAAPFFGFFLYRINHPAIFSLCYAPWPLYCWLRIILAGRRQAVAGWIGLLALANLALMNSGTVKEAYMLLVSLNGAGACVLLFSSLSWRQRLLRLGGVAWCGVLFVMITAPGWLTFFDTLRDSLTLYNPSSFQIQPGVLLGAFDEAFYRPLTKGLMVFNPSVNFVILAGLLYLFATLRLHFANRMVVGLMLATTVPFAITFGILPPSWIIQVPFLANVAHTDNTFTCVLIILWSVLAGVGFTTASQRLQIREGRDDLLVAGLLLLVLIAAYLGFGQAAHRGSFGPGQTLTVFQLGDSMRVPTFVWGYLATLIVALVAVSLTIRRALLQRRLTPAAGLVLALGAILLIWRQGFHVEAMGFEDYVAKPTKRVDLHAVSPAISFMQTAQKDNPSRSVGLRGHLFPGWNDAYQIESINGPDAIMNPYYRELVDSSPVERTWGWRLFVMPHQVSSTRPFLDFLNVRYYLTLQGDRELISPLLTLRRQADFDVFESPTAWPRAFFTDRLLVYNQPAELIAAIQGGDGRPFASIQASKSALDPGLAGLSRDLAGRSVKPAGTYHLTNNTTSFDVETAGPGMIVLHETWMPHDMRAELDGQPTHVWRINHTFRGIFVATPGNHHVTFRYWPWHFTASLWLCTAGLVLATLSLFIGLRPATTTSPVESISPNEVPC